jgi:putative glycosyltransferase (TIGR04372 family)
LQVDAVKIGKYRLLKPYDSFGNRAEDIYYGILACRREETQLILLKRKWNLIGKVAFRDANIAMLDVKHPLIVDNIGVDTINFLLTLWWSVCRVIGVAWRKLQGLMGRGSPQNFLVRWSEVEIGRDTLWGVVSPPYSEANQTIDWGKEHDQKLAIRFDSRLRLEKCFPELRGKPYICLHVRTGGFLNDHKYSAPRNSSIENYLPAIDELVTRGYFVVRLGDSAMPPLQRNGVLDYAHHRQRSQFHDILLVEHCEAYVGSLTGPIDLACLFEKRILTLNTLSIAHCTWYRAGSLFIPKKAKLNGKTLSLKQQIDLNLYEIMGNGHMNSEVEWIENSADEILAALREFLQNPALTAEQTSFNAYLRQALNHYCEETSIWETPKADCEQKMRWMARHHKTAGGIARCWLTTNWN